MEGGAAGALHRRLGTLALVSPCARRRVAPRGSILPVRCNEPSSKAAARLAARQPCRVLGVERCLHQAARASRQQQHHRDLRQQASSGSRVTAQLHSLMESPAAAAPAALCTALRCTAACCLQAAQQHHNGVQQGRRCAGAGTAGAGRVARAGGTRSAGPRQGRRRCCFLRGRPFVCSTRCLCRSQLLPTSIRATDGCAPAIRRRRAGAWRVAAHAKTSSTCRHGPADAAATLPPAARYHSPPTLPLAAARARPRTWRRRRSSRHSSRCTTSRRR